MKFPTLLLLLSLIPLQLYSQNPVFSEVQNARVVGKKHFELTPIFSTVSASDGNNSEHIQTEYGLRAAIGLTDKMDFQVKSEVVPYQGSDYSDTGFIIGFGPKISLMENKVALSLPFVGFYEWEFQPALLLTWPAIPNKLDITISPKYIFTFCEACQDFGAINFGLAISSDLSKWAIRPEYGRLYDYGEKGYVGQFSIGLSKTFGKGVE